MKTIGIGVDIIDNSRIKKSITNKRFLSKIFSNSEIKKSKNNINKTSYFSKRFAAKEAFSKALGTGFRKGLNFQDISINNDNHYQRKISFIARLRRDYFIYFNTWLF